MRLKFAHRPRYRFSRVNPQPLRHPHKDYLRQRWTYRQQYVYYPKRPLGYGLAFIPWGWPTRQLTAQHRA